MEIGFDIFQQVNENRLIWVERVREFQQARNRILHLESASPGTYLIYDAKERTVLEVSGEQRLTPSAEPGEKQSTLGTEIDPRGILGSFITVCRQRLAGLNHKFDKFIREMGEEETRIRCDDTLRRIQSARNKWLYL
jgi:hypothetical protein